MHVRALILGLSALVAAATAGVTLPTERAAASPSETPAAKLGKADWKTICVNKTPQSQAIGHPYQATTPANANCRVLTVGSDTRERRFVVSVPQSALRRKRTPVLFMLHGTSGTGEQFWNISRWRELAAQRGFVAVFPSSLAYNLTDSPTVKTTIWNSIGQTCDLVEPKEIADDIGFVRAILADLRSKLRVDPRRIYVAGFSNGSQMAHRVAAEMGDVFAAGAGWAGYPYEQCAADPLVPSPHPIPFWAGVGSKDDRFMKIIGGEASLEPATIATQFRAWLQPAAELFRLETSGVPTQAGTTQSIDDLVTQPHAFDAIATPVWSPVLVYDRPLAGNTAGNSYRFVVLDELDHQYANASRSLPPAKIRAARGVTMAALHMQFFEDHPKP